MNETMEKVPSANSRSNGFESTRGPIFTPRIDIHETDVELLLTADLPGVKADAIDLRYEKNELTLTARRTDAERTGHLLGGEYETGDYFRTFRVTESIDASRIEAAYKNGVLTVHLPKVAAMQPRQVVVKPAR
jgi:HSP20 family protein